MQLIEGINGNKNNRNSFEIGNLTNHKRHHLRLLLFLGCLQPFNEHAALLLDLTSIIGSFVPLQKDLFLNPVVIVQVLKNDR